MNDTAYRKRLAADLPKWREAGWVTADGATAILAAVLALFIARRPRLPELAAD